MSRHIREQPAAAGEQVYRVWIAGCGGWQPERWNDVPPEAVTIEPADDGHFTAERALQFLEGFNSQMLLEPKGRWAIAVPVAIHYDGDLATGQRVAWPQMARCRLDAPAAAG